VREWFSTLDETFEVWAIEIGELREHDGVVMVMGAVHAIARESRVELDFPTTAVVEVCDGKVTRLRIFRDHDEALAAVGG
jgi:ketosteroid isomerase-like protein